MPTQHYSEATLHPERNQSYASLAVYKPNQTFYTDQIGKSPHRLIRGNRYQMILHKIDGNYTWIETMKNKKEGEVILDQLRALARMKDQGIFPKQQVLENDILAAYRK